VQLDLLAADGCFLAFGHRTVVYTRHLLVLHDLM